MASTTLHFAAGTKSERAHMTELGVTYSVGRSSTRPVYTALAALPPQVWLATIDPDGSPRPRAQVAELTGWIPASSIMPFGGPADLNLTGRHNWPRLMQMPAADRGSLTCMLSQTETPSPPLWWRDPSPRRPPTRTGTDAADPCRFAAAVRQQVCKKDPIASTVPPDRSSSG